MCEERGQDVGCESRNVKWFRGGLVFKAHRLVYHSTLGLRVIKKKKEREQDVDVRGKGNTLREVDGAEDAGFDERQRESVHS